MGATLTYRLATAKSPTANSQRTSFKFTGFCLHDALTPPAWLTRAAKSVDRDAVRHALRPRRWPVRNRTSRHAADATDHMIEVCVFAHTHFRSATTFNARGREQAKGVDDVGLESCAPIPGVIHPHRAVRRRLSARFQVCRDSPPLLAVDNARMGRDRRSTLDGNGPVRCCGWCRIPYQRGSRIGYSRVQRLGESILSARLGQH